MRASTSSAVTMERSVYQKRREHNRGCATEGEIPAIWRRRDAAVKYPWQCGAARVGMQGLWEAGCCPLMIDSYSDDVRLLLYEARVIYAGSVNIIRSQRMYADIYIYIFRYTYWYIQRLWYPSCRIGFYDCIAGLSVQYLIYILHYTRHICMLCTTPLDNKCLSCYFS